MWDYSVLGLLQCAILFVGRTFPQMQDNRFFKNLKGRTCDAGWNYQITNLKLMKTRPSAYPVPEQGGVACLRSNLFSLFLWSLDEYSAFTRDLKRVRKCIGCMYEIFISSAQLTFYKYYCSLVQIPQLSINKGCSLIGYPTRYLFRHRYHSEGSELLNSLGL